MNNPYDIIISRNENATSFVELNDQYNALYNLLINNQRQISYLDLYKITEYINTPEESVQIGSKFAQLNPNTAIGIGIPSVKFNGVEFYQGDLLLKLSNGQMQKLDAPSHGIYFPKWESKNNIGKKLIWVYSKEEPNEPTDTTTPQPMTEANNAESLLYWDIPNVSVSNGYGQKIEQENLEGGFWSTSFKENIRIEEVKETGSNEEEVVKETRIYPLVPIIKCFHENNGINEEILADIKINLVETTETKNNETITIKVYQVSNIPSCVNYLMIR